MEVVRQKAISVSEYGRVQVLAIESKKIVVVSWLTKQVLTIVSPVIYVVKRAGMKGYSGHSSLQDL